MADGTIKIATQIDPKGIEKGLQNIEKSNRKTFNNINKEIGNLTSGISKKFNSLASGIAKGMTNAIGGISVAISGATVGIAKIGAEFEQQMSKVQAISGATADDIQALTDKAKEMGATTQFSAKESAQALEYMALAGFKTQDMLDSLSGVMNLAAASGEDLALVSDIVTDGLSAFGLAAKDSQRFADVLAAASSNANTNVAMLGESFKYVAPVAGALGYSIEDTSVALGLMANAGIKASSSGTALRTLLTNLVSPNKSAAAAMTELGVSVTDATGNMLPFKDVLLQLRDGFSALTNEQKAQYAEILAGKEGMSGLLAVVNATENDFVKLSNAINNSTGAAENMAAIMQDNLAGAIKIFKSSLEGIALSLYENMQEPLKNSVQYITELVNNLKEAFDKGGVQGFVAEFGNVFADFLTKIADNIPEVIELASNFIVSFSQGILANSGQLVQAGLDILGALAIGILNAMPTLIETGITLISEFFTGIISYIIENKDKIIEKIGEIISNIASSFGDMFPILEPVTKIIEKLAENLDILIPIVAGVTAGVVTFKAAIAISNIIESTTTALKNFSLANKIAAGAQAALNAVMNANPFVLVATLIAGVVTALITLYNTNENFRNKVKKLWQDIKTAVGNAVTSIIEFFTVKIPEALDKAWTFIKEFPGKTIEIGKDIVRGLWQGIKDTGTWLKEKITGFCKGIMDNIKGFFGIHSPARRLRDEVGVMLTRGMAIGVEQEKDKVVNALIKPYEIARDELKSSNPFANEISNIIDETKATAIGKGKSFEDVGKSFSSAITTGIDSNKNRLIQKVTGQVDELLKANITQVERNGKDLITAYKNNNDKLLKNYEQSIKANSNLTKAQSKELIANYKNTLSENLQQYTEKVNEEVARDKEKFKTAGTELMTAFKNSVEEQANSIDTLINERFSNLTNNFKGEFDNLIQAQEQLRSKLAAGDLFGFEKIDDEKSKVVIEDLDKTINNLERYDVAISKLKDKGISDALLGELSKYSVEDALAITEKLLKMTDTEFTALSEKWTEKQELATKVASNFYKEQIQTLETDFNNQLLELLNQLPTDVEDIGVMAIQGFQDGINSKMGNILSDVRSFADSVISTMQSALDIHSPSRKTMWLGEMTDKGFEQGLKKGEKNILRTINKMDILGAFKSKLPNIQSAVLGSIARMTPKSTTSNVYNRTSTKNITNNQGDLVINVDKINASNTNEIDAFLKQASFYQKQRAQALGGV